MTIVEILDKNIDQENLLKDFAGFFLAPKAEELKAKILSGEIDLIPGTDIDNTLLAQAVDKLVAFLMA